MPYVTDRTKLDAVPGERWYIAYGDGTPPAGPFPTHYLASMALARRVQITPGVSGSVYCRLDARSPRFPR